MTIESNINRNRYVGNGSTTDFAFTFKAWEPDQVLVYTGDGSVETEVSSSCTISLSATGGTVSFPEAPASGTVVLIRRSMPYLQEDNYVNGTRFDGAEIEDRFDMDCAERQDLRADVDRCVRMPETSSETTQEFVQSLFEARGDAVDAAEAAQAAQTAAEAAQGLAETAQGLAESAQAAAETARDQAHAIADSDIIAAGGSQPRSLSAHFSDLLSVKDFGAKGDGTTNDTAAFASAASSGKHVFIPHGSYVINSTVSGGKFYSFGEISFTNLAVEHTDLSYYDTNKEKNIPYLNAGSGSIVYAIPYHNDSIYGWAVGVQGVCENKDTVYVLRYNTGNIYKYSKDKNHVLAYVGKSNDSSSLGHQGIDVDLSGYLIVPCSGNQHISKTSWVSAGDLALNPIKIIPDSFDTSVSPSAVLSKDKSELVCTGVDAQNKRCCLIYDYADLTPGQDATGKIKHKVILQDWNDAHPVQAIAYDGTYIYIVCGSATNSENNIHYYVYNIEGKKLFYDGSYAVGRAFALGQYSSGDSGSYIIEPEALTWMQTSKGVELCTTLQCGHAEHRFAVVFSNSDALNTAANSLTFYENTLQVYGSDNVNHIVLAYKEANDALIIGRRAKTVGGLQKDSYIKSNSYFRLGTFQGTLGLTVQESSQFVVHSHNGTSGSIGRETALLRIDKTNGCRIEGDLYPLTTSAYSLGKDNNRWSNVYAVTTTIGASDERMKRDIECIPEAVFRAWSRVDFKQYVFKDAYATKGNSARIHIGVIAQRVKEAFEAEGLDAFRYGLLCYDEWVAHPDIYNEQGELLDKAQEAGSMYSMRYEEALCLECAYQRWRLEQLEERINQLTGNSNS